MIEWDEYGYPTQESLEKLEQILNGNDIRKAIKAFYSALKENYYPDCCGYTEVEVRGKIEKVWEYHTGGWSGNEDIICVLENSWIWSLTFERYDAGGHYYFKPWAICDDCGEGQESEVEEGRLKKFTKIIIWLSATT